MSSQYFYCSSGCQSQHQHWPLVNGASKLVMLGINFFSFLCSGAPSAVCPSSVQTTTVVLRSRWQQRLRCRHRALGSHPHQTAPQGAGCCQLRAGSCAALGVTTQRGAIFCEDNLLEPFLRSCLQGEIL